MTKRGTTGGTPSYGTPGGYPQSKGINSASFAGGVSEAIFGLVVLFLDWRHERKASHVAH